MSLTDAERETIISMSDAGDTAQIYSSQRRIITKLKKNAAAVLLDEGTFEGSAWAKFEMPRALISFRSTTIKREMTDEQRQAAAERFAKYRAGSANNLDEGGTDEDNEADEDDE